jgi:hypothetical protein
MECDPVDESDSLNVALQRGADPEDNEFARSPADAMS